MNDTLGKLRARQETVEEASRQRIAELDVEAQKLTTEAVAAEREAESVRRRGDELRAELARTTSSQMLGEFIADRAGSDDYRKYLGVPALIHRDFEQLSKMFKAQRDDEEEGKDSNDDMVVNRIILYVDDLDRCPPDKVVEVLRAIHLLLAFPLFVVVVGVDARWVSRALKQQHRFQLRVGGGEVEADDDHEIEGVATPEDYLEKIFQLGFWLSPMTDKTCSELLTGIAGAAEPEPEAKPGGAPGDTGVPGRAPPPAPATAAVTGLSQSAQPDGVKATPVEAVPLQPPPPPPPPAPPVGPAPDLLRFTKAEQCYLLDLAPLLKRSPRAVKRFVNSYRLLKVAAGVGDDGSDPSFRSTMLVLALTTGGGEAGRQAAERLDGVKDDQTPAIWAAALQDDVMNAGARNGMPKLPIAQTPLRDLPPIVELVRSLEEAHGVTNLRAARQAAALARRVSFAQGGV